MATVSPCTPVVNAKDARYLVSALFRAVRQGKTFVQLLPRQVSLSEWRRLYMHLVHLLRVNATTKAYRRIVRAALTRALNSQVVRPTGTRVAEFPMPASRRLQRRICRFVEVAELLLASSEQYEQWSADPCAEWQLCPPEEAKMFRQDDARIKNAFKKHTETKSDLWLRDAYATHECKQWNPSKERHAVLYIRRLLSKEN